MFSETRAAGLAPASLPFQHREEEDVGDDEEIDKQLDNILTGGELDKHEIDGARKGTKSKSELLAELRRQVSEKPKSKFKPIGKNKHEVDHEEKLRRRDEEKEKNKKREREEAKRRQEKEKRRKIAWERRSPAPSAEQIQNKIQSELETNDDTPVITPEGTPDTETPTVESTGLKVEIFDGPAKPAYVVLPDPKSKKKNADLEMKTLKKIDDADDSGGDIFSDAGTDYNPLSDDDDDNDDDDEEDHMQLEKHDPKAPEAKRSTESSRPKRDYFASSSVIPPRASGTEPTPSPSTKSHSPPPRQQSQMMDLIQQADLSSILKNVRAQKQESQRQGLVPLQGMGGDYDIEDDLGAEGRWLSDEEEDYIGRKGPKGAKNSKRRK